MAMRPPGLPLRSQDFKSLWQLSKKIGDGGQGEIHTTYPTKSNSKYYFSSASAYNNPHPYNHSSSQSRNSRYSDEDTNAKFITKKIKLSVFGEGGRGLIVNHYEFFQNYKLLNIYGIYHDHLNKQILVVMQYLQHELEDKYIDDVTPTFSTRFSRPGYIYLKSELSLKLFITQLTSQLDIIHSHNRIHFDLKPQILCSMK